MKSEENYILDVQDWAEYIMHKYQGEISPIKLQKALYFCFAFWAGFVNKKSLGNVEDSFNYNTYLFEEEFEAWTYGPVIRSIYDKYKNGALHEKDLPDDIKDNNVLCETIDSILDDVFVLSDFKLVALSHEDSSWKNHYRDSDDEHNVTIPREEIRDEYTEKSFA